MDTLNDIPENVTWSPKAFDPAERARQFAGVLMGCAVGDSIGLPFEGMSQKRVAACLKKRKLAHRFFFGCGMCSDDTEHTCMVAQALLASGGDPDRFTRSLAWRFRGWLLGAPAGIGLATLRSLVKLWLGFGPKRSGVFSAGNGPAMRSAIIGVYAADNPALMEKLVRASTCLTHTDPKALEGAMVIAVAAAEACKTNPASLDVMKVIIRCGGLIQDTDLHNAWQCLMNCRARGATPAEFAEAMGLERGVTGYVVHTVPIAVYCWLHHLGDYEATITSVVKLGGDTDTVAAIAGALAGASGGADSIPGPWKSKLIEWPRSRHWLTRLAEELSVAAPVGGGPGGEATPLWLNPLALLTRNILFIIWVLAHGFRRLLPPYG